MPPPRILHIGSDLAGKGRAVERAAVLGFDTLLFTPAPEERDRNDPADGAVGGLAEHCAAKSLRLFADIDAYALDLDHPLVEEYPEFFAIRRSGEGRVIDPRHLGRAHGIALLRPPDDPEPLVAWWSAVFAQYREAGVTGFRLQHPGKCGPRFWEALICELRAEAGELTLIADTPGKTREDIANLAGCGFDCTLSSLAWWDGRAPWLVEEHAALARVALVRAAGEHGMELALDFATQCSPDHPWLKEHPGWFDWRPDGTIKYAENPPKKYEDIVNLDFYKPDAMPDLRCALRDVVLHWVTEGVRIFRVDNPHTKPLPFWRWMIEEVRKEHPGVIFLSEAFTRPKLMYRLAKLGFSQSYTYFTWRDKPARVA